MKHQAVDKTVQAAKRGESRAAARERVPESPSASLMRLQRYLGNRALGRFLQAKLKVGVPGDRFEREADRVAEQVVAVPLQSAFTHAPLHIQRYVEQTTESANTAPASVDRVLASPGRPMESALQQDMEQRFGQDFSGVRVHTGAAAEQSTQDVNANAYTIGHNVVFGSDRYSPGTQEGRRLIAHELTHVVQQTSVDRSYGRAVRPISLPVVYKGALVQPGENGTFAKYSEADQGIRISRDSPLVIQRQGGPAETAAVVGTALAAVGILQNQFGKPDGGLNWSSDMATYPEDLKVVPGTTKPVDNPVALFYSSGQFVANKTRFNLRGDFGPKTMANVRIELVETTSYYGSLLNFTARALKVAKGSAEHPKICFVCSGRFDPAGRGDCTYNVTLEVDEDGRANAIRTEIVEGDPELINLSRQGDTMGFRLSIGEEKPYNRRGRTSRT